MFLHHLIISGKHLLPFHKGRNTAPRKHLKAFGFRQGLLFSFFLTIALCNCFSQRMLRHLLCRCADPIKPVSFIFVQKTHHPDYLGRSICQCSCFIKCDSANLGKPFQRIAFPYEKTVLCCIADRCHNGSRCCKHQRTGTEYNQNRNRPDNFTGNQPGKRCRRKCNDYHPGCPTVCNSDNLRFSGIGRLHQTDHSLNRTVLTDPCRLHLKYTKLIHGSA